MTELAKPVHSCLNRIVYQSCRMLWIWKGLSGPSQGALDIHFCLNRIVYQSCRLLWTWKGLSKPSHFTFVLTGLFISLVGCFGHGRD